MRSGQYARVFRVPVVIIAYATTGQTPKYRETRRETMCRWTMEVLSELRKKNWAGIFRFASVGETLYDEPLFSDAVWYRPDSASPVRLLTP